MKQLHHVIFVPGIRDNLYHVQGWAVKLWRLSGVRGHCHVMPWAGSEAYEPKLQRLQDEIAAYLARGDRVSLIGASAGASAVLTVYTERPDKLHGVALICPKVNHPETVRQATYDGNPAYRTALERLQSALPNLTVASRARVTTYYSVRDGIIPYEDSRMLAVSERKLPPWRHGYAIMYALTLGAPAMLGRLKQY